MERALGLAIERLFRKSRSKDNEIFKVHLYLDADSCSISSQTSTKHLVYYLPYKMHFKRVNVITSCHVIDFPSSVMGKKLHFAADVESVFKSPLIPRPLKSKSY